MATTETISSNYAGEAAERFFSNVLKSAASITNGAVTFQDGIQYKWNLPLLNLSGIVADATCDFTDTGTVTRSEQVLTVEEFEVNMKLCVKTYRPTFDRMGGSRAGSLAPNFASYLIELVAANVAQRTENTIWGGTNATAGEFDGFETLLTTNASQPAAQELAVVMGGITAANVIGELERIVDATPSALYDSDGYAIRIPTNVYKFYVQAQSALGAYDAYHERRAGLNFQGIPLIHCPGLTDDTMIATYRDNLFYGAGSADDAMSVDLVDTRVTLGDGNVRVAMYWADGVQYANGADIVTYNITNTAN